MREDMARVIVERPRIKAFKVRKGRRVDFDDMPRREGMKRGHAWRGDTKELNENLQPLRRYLASQVGRPWGKIYSEIAAHLRVDSAVQQHVRDHLRDFVAVTPKRDIHNWRSSIRGGLWWQEFYVDPRTGLLSRTDRLPEEKARRRAGQNRSPQPRDRIAMASDCELRQIEGLWYDVCMAPLPKPIYRASREILKLRLVPHLRNSRTFEAEMEVRRLISAPVFDVVTRQPIDLGPATDTPDAWATYLRTQPERSYAVAKRLLSSRELREHGLRNTDG